jgi:hypothetical protein
MRACEYSHKQSGADSASPELHRICRSIERDDGDSSNENPNLFGDSWHVRASKKMRARRRRFSLFA